VCYRGFPGVLDLAGRHFLTSTFFLYCRYQQSPKRHGKLRPRQPVSQPSTFPCPFMASKMVAGAMIIQALVSPATSSNRTIYPFEWCGSSLPPTPGTPRERTADQLIDHQHNYRDGLVRVVWLAAPARDSHRHQCCAVQLASENESPASRPTSGAPATHTVQSWLPVGECFPAGGLNSTTCRQWCTARAITSRYIAIDHEPSPPVYRSRWSLALRSPISW
jgi:hypothetical protein